MIPDFSKKMTIGEAYGPAMEMTDPNEAKKYFEALVKHIMSDGKIREKAEQIAKSNLGYYAGYYDSQVMARVQKLFNCVHPVFGSVEPTAEQAFEMGKKMGERVKEGLPIKTLKQPKNKRRVLRKILM